MLLFWGHDPEPDGRPGPGCLSQWWPAPFESDGQRFATAEHYMMWRKARLFDDPDAAERALAAPDPKAAKSAGRSVRGFSPQVWTRHRFAAVVCGNLAKFSAHPDLRAFLVGTGDRTLAEASPVDAVWGIGLASGHPDALDPARWPGLNLLGRALMEVRTALADPAR